jgi:hypothetical protein
LAIKKILLDIVGNFWCRNSINGNRAQGSISQALAAHILGRCDANYGFKFSNAMRLICKAKRLGAVIEFPRMFMQLPQHAINAMDSLIDFADPRNAQLGR